MSIAEFKKLNEKGEPKQKYGNKKTVINGVTFDSAKEARRYVDLTLWQQSKQIHSLEHQKPFPLVVNGIEVAEYFADFVYFKDGEMIVEDVKSKATRKDKTYRLKYKMFEAIYGITIQEL